MANDYTLNLKAVLDTSDVQQKIQKLQSTQNADKTGANPVNGNFTSLFQRLNTTLMNLQRSIDRLGSGRGLADHRGMVPTAAATAARGAPPITLNGQSTSPSVARFRPASGLTQAEFNALRSMNVPVGRPLSQLQHALYLKAKDFPGQKFIDACNDPTNYSKLGSLTYYGMGNNMGLTNRRINNGWTPPTFKDSKIGKNLKDLKNDFKRRSQLGRMGLTVGGSMLLGGITNYAEATGHTGVSTAANFGSKMTMGAAMGMQAGPVGAAIGMAGGALAASFELLTKKATEAAAALATQKAAVYKGQEVDKRLNSYIRDKTDAKQLKNGNVGYFQHQLELATDLNKRQEAQLQKIGLGGTSQGRRFNLRNYESETLRLQSVTAGGRFDKRIAERKKRAALYASNAPGWMESGDRIESLKETIKNLVGEKSKTTVGQSIATDQSIFLKGLLTGTIAPQMGQLNSLASQGFMTSTADDKAYIEQQLDYLKKICDLTRDIRDQENKMKITF